MYQKELGVANRKAVVLQQLKQQKLLPELETGFVRCAKIKMARNALTRDVSIHARTSLCSALHYVAYIILLLFQAHAPNNAILRYEYFNLNDLYTMNVQTLTALSF